MSELEDNFDEFLRQKVQESHFEYDESHWLKAEQMIAGNEPKKKTFWLGFGIGVLSLSIVAGITSLVFLKSDKAETASMPKYLSETTPVVKSAQVVQDLPVTAATQTAVVHNKVSATRKADAVVTAASFAKGNTQQRNYLAANTLKANQVNALHAVPQQAANNHLQLNALNSTSSDATNKAEQNIDHYGNQNRVQAEAVELLDEKTITIGTPIVIDSRNEKAVDEESNKGSNKDIDVNIATACEHQNKNEWMFSALAGVSDSRGFEGNTASDSRIGFGYFGGCRLAYKLDKNWFVGVQPLFYSRGAINTSIETEKTDYAFGAQADQFVVKNKALMFIEMPVTIGYRVLRHQISVGAGVEYLANVKSDVKEFGTINYKSNQWGYTDGFNRVGTIATFNYAFNLYQEFWITLMIQKGFTDFTKAGYFTNNSVDKNSNLRIGLQYQFSNQKKKLK
ncbi:MAG: hypothetical protein ACK46S_01640 [Bacteroidota bacterium]|jgi:hypothetical protein